MRIGIIALLHASNTFVRQLTTLDRFREDLLLEGKSLGQKLATSQPEMGGFLAGLAAAGAEAVPLLVARAAPAGMVTADAWRYMTERILTLVAAAGDLDGLLVACHGAAVSQLAADADGYWLSKLRQQVGPQLPIIGTLDAHANLSPQMVAACDALVACRTNPPVDQRERGLEAATLMVRTVRGEIQPTMAASLPAFVINIERQCTSEPHLQPICDYADAQLATPGVLSNSLLLGFPLADVPEMGSAAIVITDNAPQLAQELADQLADQLWAHSDDLIGQLVSVHQAVTQCQADPSSRYCLLDMGDDGSSGSAADGTTLASVLLAKRLGPSFLCINDPDAVETCIAAGAEARLTFSVGGKVDEHHGKPLKLDARVVSLHSGRFHQDQTSHDGLVDFDQGATAVIESVDGCLTIMLTSRRTVPWSLKQLTSCQVDPKAFRILVAKGTHAPLAAYRDVCDKFIRVNTMGSTCADLEELDLKNRRRPMFPFEI